MLSPTLLLLLFSLLFIADDVELAAALLPPLLLPPCRCRYVADLPCHTPPLTTPHVYRSRLRVTPSSHRTMPPLISPPAHHAF